MSLLYPEEPLLGQGPITCLVIACLRVEVVPVIAVEVDRGEGGEVVAVD